MDSSITAPYLNFQSLPSLSSSSSSSRKYIFASTIVLAPDLTLLVTSIHSHRRLNKRVASFFFTERLTSGWTFLGSRPSPQTMTREKALL
jgi:hypothetical protein